MQRAALCCRYHSLSVLLPKKSDEVGTARKLPCIKLFIQCCDYLQVIVIHLDVSATLRCGDSKLQMNDKYTQRFSILHAGQTQKSKDSRHLQKPYFWIHYYSTATLQLENKHVCSEFGN